MPDDDRIDMQPPVIQQNHLQILPDTCLAVDTVAQRIGHVVNAHLILQSLEIHHSHILTLPSSHSDADADRGS